MIKKLIKKTVPRGVIECFRKPWDRWKEASFRRQKTGTMRIHEYTLEIPEHHSLQGMLKSQPYRDLCIGIAAKFISRKYPDKAIIDIGANVGDTAAMIAHYCDNRLILVEGSDFYADYLETNAARLGNEFEIHRVIINDGRTTKGALQHWGGTAVFKNSDDGPVIETVRLGDLTKDPVCFVKTDTDGFDFGILTAGIDWIAGQKPALLYECQIRSAPDLEAATALIARLCDAGYGHFIVWDAAGHHMLSTSDVNLVYGIHRYLLKTWESRKPGNLSNLDIACFHAGDRDVFDAVTHWYGEN